MIGFIGCGQMGYPIAANLLRAGYRLRVYDLDPQKSAALVALNPGAMQVATPGAAVEPGGIVVTMVPDDEALRQVALGADGILHHLGEDGVHLSLSTVSPTCSEALAAQYAWHGSTFLAANVSGRPDVAAAARLSIYLAGDAPAKARVRPLLEAIGQHVYDLGESVTAANAAKLAANYLIVANLIALASAAAFVERHDVDRTLFLRAMAESPLFGGAVFEQYGAAMIGPRAYHDAKFPVTLGLKDVRLLLAEAARVDLTLPGAELAREALQAALEQGRGKEDWSVLAEFCTAIAARNTAKDANATEELETDGKSIVLSLSVHPAIEIRELCKSFGSSVALDHLSLTIQRGEIFGLLGPNGSGKTTTMNLLSGLSKPTSGTVHILGYDVQRHMRQIRRILGAVPQETALYEELTAWTNLEFHADLFGIPRREKKHRIEAMLELVQLTERRHSRVKTFSGGMKRRLALARALLHDPQLLYLDEPTLGVDVQSRRALWDYIRALRDQGKTVLLTTNYLEEAQELCDRLAILDHGTVLAIDTPARLRQRYGGQVIDIESEQPLTILTDLQAFPGVISAEQKGTHLRLVAESAGDLLSPILNQVAREGAIRHVAVAEPGLDEVFLRLTGSQVRDENPRRSA